MSGNKVLYVGRLGLPEDASGIRVMNIALVLRKIGYKVVFFSSRCVNKTEPTKIESNGFDYYFSKSILGRKIFRIIFELFELVFARVFFNRIVEYVENSNVKIIILYNDSFYLTKRMLSYCESNGIKLVADVTEWYQRKCFTTLGDILFTNLANHRIKKLDRRVENIISISPYLNQYYQEIGCNSLFIPPIFEMDGDIRISKYNYYENYVINLVYAGSPGSKDILLPAIDAIIEINKVGIRIRLDIVGLDSDYFFNKRGNIKFKNFGIVPHGRLPHNKTLEIVRNADFGLLLRHKKRYAKAGFSTKFAECMANGVAMVCNHVGGADSIIEDTIDGIILEHSNKRNIYEALLILLETPIDDILEIRRNAFLKADRIFNSEHYLKILEDFVS